MLIKHPTASVELPYNAPRRAKFYAFAKEKGYVLSSKRVGLRMYFSLVSAPVPVAKNSVTGYVLAKDKTPVPRKVLEIWGPEKVREKLLNGILLKG